MTYWKMRFIIHEIIQETLVRLPDIEKRSVLQQNQEASLNKF